MESPLRAAAGAPDLKLIETLAWDGAAFVRMDLHLARLHASADLLGWCCGDARAALHAAAPLHPARVRLTMTIGGTFDVTVTALPPLVPLWRVALAQGRLSATDPWLQIKSSNRAAYDTARATLPAGLDEVIFQNERGEVCDGTITMFSLIAAKACARRPCAAACCRGCYGRRCWHRARRAKKLCRPPICPACAFGWAIHCAA